MNRKSSSFESTNYSKPNDIKHSNNVTSKLRRLKIEETLLLQRLHKIDMGGNYKIADTDHHKNMDYKNMVNKLRDSYINIKNLLEEVKTVTCSQDLLADLEIDELKNKVLELETTLKSTKTYLNTELRTMKISEKEIMKQMEEIKRMETNTIKKRSKIASTNYNQVVPSPVRLMMTSPYKCKEVQEFQDFMKNSPNRYGGWNEYHHNIFVKYWKKHFGSSTYTDDGTLVENLTCDNFVEEVLIKLQDFDKRSLMSHIKWYKKYVYLKDKQQDAIDKWKSKKNSMKKVMIGKEGSNDISRKQDCDLVDTDKSDLNDIACEFAYLAKEENTKLYDSPNWRKSQCDDSKMLLKPATGRKLSDQFDIERIMKPTKQWLSRNNGDEPKMQQMNFIETMQRLRTPSWRQHL